jgi:uncharacterized protein
MRPSMFNVLIPLPGRDECFLMNTLTDSQLVITSDVATLLDRLGRGTADTALNTQERDVFSILYDNGFIVDSRQAEQSSLDDWFLRLKADTSELSVTILTTLQCNFACDYCFQGDHGDYNQVAAKMTLETAAKVIRWIEREVDRVHPSRLAVMFFGGEPLLNVPVMYALSEGIARFTGSRNIPLSINIITNGLLLSSEIVQRLLPLGLKGIKITLDGDRATHDRLRPLRGGQGTFDRIIANVGSVASLVRVSIGGNFDGSSVDSLPALLEFLKSQKFAADLGDVHFKPIVRTGPTLANGVVPLIPVNVSGKPLKGTCMTSVGAGAGATCDSCNVLDDKMTMLRDETKRHGFSTHDDLHNGPCHVHMRHAHTIGPDGSLYPCPGFTGEQALSTGHIDDRYDDRRESAREMFERLHPWKDCGDCAYIPVCAGGCVAASYSRSGDINVPMCHKPSFEAAAASLAYELTGSTAASCA